MGKIIDGTSLALAIQQTLATDVAAFTKKHHPIRLGIVMIGTHRASEVYIAKKRAVAETLGIQCSIIRFPSVISQQKLLKELADIQAPQHGFSGIIVQLPLPQHLSAPVTLNAIHPDLDVDCLTDANIGRVVMGTHAISPPTAGAILSILQSLRINLTGKKVAVVGTGALVGKPTALLLINAQATVLTANRSTVKLAVLTKQADIIITGVGKAGLIRGSMIKKNAVVIDAGISFDRHHNVRGDVHMPSVLPIARAATPTPGGVGPLTVVMLMKNTFLLAKKAVSQKKSPS